MNSSAATTTPRETTGATSIDLIPICVGPSALLRGAVEGLLPRGTGTGTSTELPVRTQRAMGWLEPKENRSSFAGDGITPSAVRVTERRPVTGRRRARGVERYTRQMSANSGTTDSASAVSSSSGSCTAPTALVALASTASRWRARTSSSTSVSVPTHSTTTPATRTGTARVRNQR